MGRKGKRSIGAGNTCSYLSTEAFEIGGFHMENYLPYIVSVVCALISGFASYAVARKQSRADIKKLEKTYELKGKRKA